MNKTPAIIMRMLIMALSIIALPIVFDNISLSFAPKYCETRIPAPMDIPMNKTISRNTRAPLAPIAAKAPSPTYLPTITESTVL